MESVPTDVYTLTDDSAVVYSVLPGDTYLAYAEELEVIRGYLRKLPSNYHYIVGLANFSVYGKHVFEIFVGPDLEYVYSSPDWDFVRGHFEYHSTLVGGRIYFSDNDPYFAPRSGMFYLSRSESSSSGVIALSADEDMWLVKGFPGMSPLYPFVYSDVGPFPDLIDNREEVRIQYATLFGLAVFLVLDILRGFWRSARGRDT